MAATWCHFDKMDQVAKDSRNERIEMTQMLRKQKREKNRQRRRLHKAHNSQTLQNPQNPQNPQTAAIQTERDQLSLLERQVQPHMSKTAAYIQCIQQVAQPPFQPKQLDDAIRAMTCLYVLNDNFKGKSNQLPVVQFVMSRGLHPAFLAMQHAAKSTDPKYARFLTAALNLMIHVTNAGAQCLCRQSTNTVDMVPLLIDLLMHPSSNVCTNAAIVVGNILYDDIEGAVDRLLFGCQMKPLQLPGIYTAKTKPIQTISATLLQLMLSSRDVAHLDAVMFALNAIVERKRMEPVNTDPSCLKSKRLDSRLQYDRRVIYRTCMSVPVRNLMVNTNDADVTATFVEILKTGTTESNDVIRHFDKTFVTTLLTMVETRPIRVVAHIVEIFGNLTAYECTEIERNRYNSQAQAYNMKLDQLQQNPASMTPENVQQLQNMRPKNHPDDVYTVLVFEAGVLQKMLDLLCTRFDPQHDQQSTQTMEFHPHIRKNICFLFSNCLRASEHVVDSISELAFHSRSMFKVMEDLGASDSRIVQNEVVEVFYSMAMNRIPQWNLYLIEKVGLVGLMCQFLQTNTTHLIKTSVKILVELMNTEQLRSVFAAACQAAQVSSLLTELGKTKDAELNKMIAELHDGIGGADSDSDDDDAPEFDFSTVQDMPQIEI